MFTIKKYKAESLCYTAYSCKSYEVSRDVAGRIMIILDPHLDVSGSPLQTILVNSSVYIENGLGKTIDHMRCVEPMAQGVS